MEAEKAADFIEKSHYIGLVLPHSPGPDHLFAAEAILAALSLRAKAVGIISSSRSAASPERHVTLPHLDRASPLIKEFIISLDTSVSPIGQLRYENSEHAVDIIISPKSVPFKDGVVAFREGKVLCDAVILLGIPDLHAIDPASCGLSQSFFADTPLINIDNAQDNGRYGAINIVEHQASSLCEIVFRFLTASTGFEITGDIATPLLAGVIGQTHLFRAGDVAPETFLLCHQLITRGALYEEARRLAEPPRDMPLFQLAARAAVRSRIDEVRSVLWSFITADDFTKTGRDANDVPAILSRLDKDLPNHQLVALLWQPSDAGAVHVMITGPRSLLQTLGSCAPAHYVGPFLELETAFSAFTEAEDFLTQLLDSALSPMIEA